jgi:hypothetical protein
MGLNNILKYFDLASEIRPATAGAYADTGETTFHWAPQYLALLVGIITQRFFTIYIQTGSWNLGGFWGWFVASVILALMAFPAVYKATFDPKKPLFVQLCVIFASGMGWESLVDVGAKAATGG